MIPIRIITLMFAMLALAGCEQAYNGDVGGDSAQNNLDFGNYNAEGHRLYGEQCAGCHGAEGNGTQIGTPLVACATCTGIATLADEIARTMPIGKDTSVTDCDGQCASDVAEYIMYAFNGLSLYEAATSLEGVSVLPLDQTLRNATVQLAGRLPTDAEIAQVKTEGEAGFAAIMARVMNEDEFYVRLTEIFNDVFLTDKYLQVNKNENDDVAIGLVNSDDYPNKRWYDIADTDLDDNINNQNRYCSRSYANDGVAREALELINYIVRNNRPITELVTADYTMVNWYSQKVYDAELLNTSDTFREVSEGENPCLDYNSGYDDATLTHDPYDFKPAKLAGIPHAGILTSVMFLNRFPTSDTNRNRHRSYITYELFLDTDILEIQGSRPEDAIDTASENPTLDNPACYTCHTVMDPVASAFQHWNDDGRRVLSTTEGSSWDAAGISSAGLAGNILPQEGGNSHFTNMLQWLGHEIADDPRYIRAITRHLYNGIIGQDLLDAPGDDANADVVTAYNAQRAILASIGQSMVTDNWNLKTAITGILLSPYYRANTIDAGKVVEASHIGATRLLSPEMLQRKLKATLGFDWYELHDAAQDNRIMFGGIDSDSVITRIHEPSGLMAAMQERMAIDMACRATAFDFTKIRSPDNNERRLFKFVSPEIQPYDADGFPLASNIEAIKKNIQYLHKVLLSENLSLTDPEIEATYQLFLSTWQLGQAMMANPDAYKPEPSTSLPSDCRAYQDRDTKDDYRGNTPNILDSDLHIRYDENYVIRSWMSVMTYLLSDYSFIYE